MNDRNLIPIEHLSSEEAKRRGSNGGKKSVESRRRKRDMKKKLEFFLSLPCADNDRETLEAMGMPPEYWDNEAFLVVSLFQKAVAGDTRAFDKIMQILGEDVASKELKLRKKEFKMKYSKSNGEQREELPQLYKALMALAGDNDE